jgi:nucleoside 2-deoxyribosyltransferase
MLKIYLCGPITGMSWEQATGWRRQATAFLEKHGFEVLDPMRGKEAFLRGTDSIPIDLPFRYPNEILHRDRFDVTRSDALLANFLHAERPSIGSDFELAWATEQRKIIVLIAKPDSLYAQHPFVRYAVTYLTDSIEDGCEWLACNLTYRDRR